MMTNSTPEEIYNAIQSGKLKLTERIAEKVFLASHLPNRRVTKEGIPYLLMNKIIDIKDANRILKLIELGVY